MNRPFVITIISAVIAVMLALYALIRAVQIENTITDRECRERMERCKDRCERERTRDIVRIDIAEQLALQNHQQRLAGCNMIPNPLQRQQCVEQENAAFAQVWRSLRTRRQIINNSYNFCRLRCAEAAENCQQSDPPQFDPGFTLECIEDGGFVCFKPVDEICTKIEGACNGCWTSLCPGGVDFETELPVKIDLVATVGVDSVTRVLASATSQGKRSTLIAPENLALQPGESLCVRFTAPSNQPLTETRVRVFARN